MEVMSFNDPLFSTLHQLMDIPDEIEKAFNAPTRAYVRDRKAMARTPADIKELPNAYVFEVDMAGIRGSDIKVQVEEGNLLVVSGERRRPEEVAPPETKEKESKEKEQAKEEETKPRYLRMERRMGKFMRRFPLPENANTDAVSATCKDGVLTVTVEKVPPPEPKQPKTIKVEVA